jgi:hypothetical protein
MIALQKGQGGGGMGWWGTGNNDDTIGDGPADKLGGALEDLADHYERIYHHKPAFQQVLNAVLSTLCQQPENYVCDSQEYEFSQITVELDSESMVVSNQDVKAEEAAIAIFHDAFEEIAVEYQDSEMERKPRLSELLATLEFVLGYQPEEYLSDAEGLSIASIEIR